VTGEHPRLLVVWNPRAGSKAGLPTNRAGEDDLRRAMDEQGLDGELCAPGSEGEAIQRVRQAVADGYDAVVAAGGDGTVAMVAAQLLGAPTALGILPLGSAMNVARSLGIPREIPDAAGIIASGQRRRIDVGFASDGTMFLEVASVGLSARMFGEAHRVDEGQYRSLLDLVRTVATFRHHRIVLELDDRTVIHRAVMVAVANAPYTGLGLTLAPGARLDDGRFDVVVYGRFRHAELVRHLLGILGGRVRWSPKITTYRAARVRILARHPLPVRADDRGLGRTPAEFVVRPAALTVIAPLGGPGPVAPPAE
jgi:diacylglycerol kinase (ATP)